MLVKFFNYSLINLHASTEKPSEEKKMFYEKLKKKREREKENIFMRGCIYIIYFY